MSMLLWGHFPTSALATPTPQGGRIVLEDSVTSMPTVGQSYTDESTVEQSYTAAPSSVPTYGPSFLTGAPTSVPTYGPSFGPTTTGPTSVPTYGPSFAPTSVWI